MPFGGSRRWSRCRPKADIGASVGSAIYLRDQGSCLTDNLGGVQEIAQPTVFQSDQCDSLSLADDCKVIEACADPTRDVQKKDWLHGHNARLKLIRFAGAFCLEHVDRRYPPSQPLIEQRTILPQRTNTENAVPELTSLQAARVAH